MLLYSVILKLWSQVTHLVTYFVWPYQQDTLTREAYGLAEVHEEVHLGFRWLV